MRIAAIEKSLVASATGPRDMTGNVQLYLTCEGITRGGANTGWGGA